MSLRRYQPVSRRAKASIHGIPTVSYTHLLLRRVKPGHSAPALVQQLLCNLLGQFLFLAGKELIVFPQAEGAGLVRAVEVALADIDRRAEMCIRDSYECTPEDVAERFADSPIVRLCNAIIPATLGQEEDVYKRQYLYRF